MAILQVAGEDVDFLGSAVVTLTSSVLFRAGLARCAIYSTLYTKSLPFNGGPVTDAWFSFYHAARAVDSGSVLFAGLVDGATAATGLWIGNGPTHPYRYALYKFDGTTKTKLAEMTYDVMTPYGGGDPILFRVDMYVVNYGASATVSVYLDGIPVMSYSGDVTESGTTNLSCIGLFGPPSPIYQASVVSEMIVGSENTSALSLKTMAATGVGNTDDWLGAYTNENEISLNDGTSVYSNTAGQDEDFNVTDPPAGSYLVRAVVRVARASATSGAAATKVGLGFYLGSTHYPGTAQSATAAWAPYQQFYVDDPSTGNPWLYSDLAALQSNLRSSS